MNTPATAAAPWPYAEPDEEPFDEDDPDLAAIKLNQKISVRVDQLKADDGARRQLRREQRGPRPPLVELDDFLSRPNLDPSYRVSEIWPTGGRVVMTAQFKAGKTTVVGNVLRALADGADFLDRFPVRPGARVVLIDDELDDRTLQAWLTDQDISNTAAIRIVPLRGLLTTFDIRDTDLRTEWARDIAGADVVILDCLRPVLDALGLDENHEAGQFLVAFDALLKESGASEALVVHHMGHSAERSRGDSRIIDWPDALWTLVRDKTEDDPTLDDPSGNRYFSAFGRDVNLPQAELTYEPQTRRLTLGTTARNRRQATTHRRIVKADEAVLTVVVQTAGINKTKLRLAVRDNHGIGRNEDIDNAVERLVEGGLITRIRAGNTHLHYPGEAALSADLPNVPNVPHSPTGTTGMNVPAPLKGAHTETPLPDPQPDTCHHGMKNGHEPDNGRLSCPRCAIEEDRA